MNRNRITKRIEAIEQRIEQARREAYSFMVELVQDGDVTFDGHRWVSPDYPDIESYLNDIRQQYPDDVFIALKPDDFDNQVAVDFALILYNQQVPEHEQQQDVTTWLEDVAELYQTVGCTRR